jgi:hypothetical protein
MEENGMTEIKVYRNNRNGNKYVEVKHTKCGHYYVRQYMFWAENNVLNYTGYKNGRFTRTTLKRHLNELLNDYTLYGKVEG